MNDAVIACAALARCYEDGRATVEVLRGVDLSVAPGETVAITGASGSGKSTLLHLLGGLDLPSSGSVTVAGQDLAEMSDDALANMRNTQLGFVYQFHHLLPEFSAIENVAMPLLIRGEPASAARPRAKEMLEQVELGARAEHKPAELSGGERQRVAIARALITRPVCVLADEPTGNLDHENAKRVCDLMIELSVERTTAVIVVTHDEVVAGRMQRRYRLEQGRLIDS